MKKPINPCPPTFKSPRVFRNKMIEFFKWAEENNRIPYLLEFANFCMITTNTLDGYKHKPGFENDYQLIKQKAHGEILHRGMNKQADSHFAKFVLVNHEGYTSEKTESKQEVKLTAETQTLKAIQARVGGKGSSL